MPSLLLSVHCSPSPSAVPPHTHTLPSCLPARFMEKQPDLHGNRETAEKWQLNAAAPHLISTLALTEQIMGNNTPLCCGEMKCFSRRLSCCRDLFVTVPAQISLALSFYHFLSFPPSLFLPSSPLFCLIFFFVPIFSLPLPPLLSLFVSSLYFSLSPFHSLFPCIFP